MKTYQQFIEAQHGHEHLIPVADSLDEMAKRMARLGGSVVDDWKLFKRFQQISEKISGLSKDIRFGGSQPPGNGHQPQKY